MVLTCYKVRFLPIFMTPSECELYQLGLFEVQFIGLQPKLT